mmetsp:Transcript_23655/g.39038  ORF Transcript_23655/g.39038 Transcript_23655/m.39038 type:complete len:256 (-) Transcript_23655:290-1057(-)
MQSGRVRLAQDQITNVQAGDVGADRSSMEDRAAEVFWLVVCADVHFACLAARPHLAALFQTRAHHSVVVRTFMIVIRKSRVEAAETSKLFKETRGECASSPPKAPGDRDAGGIQLRPPCKSCRAHHDQCLVAAAEGLHRVVVADETPVTLTRADGLIRADIYDAPRHLTSIKGDRYALHVPHIVESSTMPPVHGSLGIKRECTLCSIRLGGSAARGGREAAEMIENRWQHQGAVYQLRKDQRVCDLFQLITEARV